MKTQYMALIKDTINKELRSKTLLIIFVVTTLTILLTNTLMKFLGSQMGQDPNMAILGINFLTMTISILNWFIYIIAVVFGISTIRSDFENNIIYQYLSFPISRMEYLFIRVVGTWVLVFGYYLYAYLLTMVLYSFSFKTNFYTAGFFGTLVLMAINILLAIFVAILFSMMMNKLAAFISIILLTITSSWSYNTFSSAPAAEWVQGLGLFKGIGLVLYMIFPRFKFLDNLSGSLMTGTVSQWTSGDLIGQVIHFIVISVVTVFLGTLLVKKRDF